MLKNISNADSENYKATESDKEDSQFASYSIKNNSDKDSTQSDSSQGEEDVVDIFNNYEINSNYATANTDENIDQNNSSDESIDQNKL